MTSVSGAPVENAFFAFMNFLLPISISSIKQTSRHMEFSDNHSSLEESHISLADNRSYRVAGNLHESGYVIIPNAHETANIWQY